MAFKPFLLFFLDNQQKLLYYFIYDILWHIESDIFFLISLSLGETLLLEPFDGKVYDLLPVFLPELLSCPSNHLCLAPGLPLPLLPSILASKMCLSSVSWRLMGPNYFSIFVHHLFKFPWQNVTCSSLLLLSARAVSLLDGCPSHCTNLCSILCLALWVVNQF